MPIYEYRCSTCGFQNDYLQKLSEPPLTDCPECGKSTFSKQVTAAGFQLKGTGWYATDFKNNNKPKPSSKEEGKGGKEEAKGSKEEGKGKSADATASADSSAGKPEAPAGGAAASSAGS